MKNVNEQRDPDARELGKLELYQVDSNTAKGLKEIFKRRFIAEEGVTNTGYFISRELLEGILAQGGPSDGLVISFGLNKPVNEGGDFQLVFETARGNEEGEIVEQVQKYATSIIGVPGPDPVIPLIKPTKTSG